MSIVFKFLNSRKYIFSILANLLEPDQTKPETERIFVE